MRSHGLTYAVLTVEGKVIRRNVWSAEHNKDPIENVVALVQTLLKQDANIRVVSIGVPGVVGASCVLHEIPFIPDLEGVALAQVLTARCGLPVYVENDMNLVALGSMMPQTEQSDSDVVFLHIGQNIGAGVVMGGRIIRGFSSFAGEIAYMVKTAAENEPGQALKEAENVSQKTQLIAGVVINCICLLNPPTIVFSGSLASEAMLQHLRSTCERWLPLWTIPSFQLMTNEEVAYERGLLAFVRDTLTKI
jgi:predicted NBD/HSP70 family sugar kinase